MYIELWASGLFFLKKLLQFKIYKKKKSDLKDQNILITGASSGIGLGLCKKLMHNNKIYAVYNKKKISSLLELKIPNLTHLKCDLFDFENYQEIEKKK